MSTDNSDGWDHYAPFYDWENARTLGRRDVPFWRGVAERETGRLLELGCGTGRLLIPLARSRAAVIGVDRSEAMLVPARARARRLPRARRPAITRADIRALPFAPRSFGAVLAPYGMLQSLTSDRDLDASLVEAARVLRRGGLLGVDLVPDLARWQEYGPTVRFSGNMGKSGHVTLIEAVRQDRRRGVTTFDETFTLKRGRRTTTRKFSLRFRTLAMAETIARIERAGFRADTLLGDYRGAPWDERADVWIVLARKK